MSTLQLSRQKRRRRRWRQVLRRRKASLSSLRLSQPQPFFLDVAPDSSLLAPPVPGAHVKPEEVVEELAQEQPIADAVADEARAAGREDG